LIVSYAISLIELKSPNFFLTRKIAKMSETEELYFVVVNHEEQYSIWPDWREIPLGWKAVGNSDSKEACLNWIETNWTDMRPKSLRDYLDKK
jgi:MbtH protein